MEEEVPEVPVVESYDELDQAIEKFFADYLDDVVQACGSDPSYLVSIVESGSRLRAQEQADLLEARRVDSSLA